MALLRSLICCIQLPLPLPLILTLTLTLNLTRCEMADDQLVAALCEALGDGHPEVNRGFGEGERVTPLWLALKDASSPEARGQDGKGRDRDGQVGP